MTNHTNPTLLEQIHEVRQDCMRALDGMIGEDDTNEHAILATAIKFLVAQLPSRIALESHLRELGQLVENTPPMAELTTDLTPAEYRETTVTTVDGTAPADFAAIREQVRRWYLRNGTWTIPMEGVIQTVDQLTDAALEAVSSVGVYPREVARLRRIEDALIAAGAPDHSEKGDPGGLTVAWIQERLSLGRHIAEDIEPTPSTSTIDPNRLHWEDVTLLAEVVSPDRASVAVELPGCLETHWVTPQKARRLAAQLLSAVARAEETER